MYRKIIFSLAIINFVYISSSDGYVASNYPQDDVDYRRSSGGGQRGVKGGSRRGNIIETNTNEGRIGRNDDAENAGNYPYRVRPYPVSVNPERSRSEDDVVGNRHRIYGSRDTNAFGQTRDSRTDGPSPFSRTDAQRQESDERRQDSRTDGQTRYEDRVTGRYDSNRGSSFRQESNEFSRNDYRGHRGRSEGNEDSNTGSYRGYGRVDSSDSRHTSGYRGYEGRTGSGRNPELSSGSFRVDGNSRVDESRTGDQRSSDTDLPVPSSGVKTKTRRINHFGQGEPGIHY